MKPTICMLALLLPMAPQYGRAQTFTPEERAKVVAYWSVSGQVTTTLADDPKKKGVWQVRLTPEASLWFWKYQQVIGGNGKPPPTMDVTGKLGDGSGWEKWVTGKLDYDRWLAQKTADIANQKLNPAWKPFAFLTSPPLPGLVPDSLLRAIGNPPQFAASVAPQQTTVTFGDGDVYAYTSHVAIRPRYAYYRFDAGAEVGGQSLRDVPDAELDSLFTVAGFSKNEQKVAKFVSRLEGGFDAVNTYDTGFVSIGFLQFITAVDGRGSLSTVLRQEKTDAPSVFEKDFRSFGVDVDKSGTLCVVDPQTGAELTGAEAVQKVISEKRLTAVFQRAGRRSPEFRTAQIKVARSTYWPLEDKCTVQLDPGTTLNFRVGDIVRSEAGMATLFDRKVNRGSVLPFADVVKAVMVRHRLKSLTEACCYEREIIAALKYRTDFLAEVSLTQPVDSVPLTQTVPGEGGAQTVPPTEPLPNP